MATIDYKEKYMQALERARQFSEKPYLEDSAGIVEYIFPELKDSEDEKVKKEITELVMQPTWKTEKEFHRRKELVAWLEKQSGKELVTYPICGWEIEKQGEQKLYINDNAKEMFIKALERVEEQNAKGYKLTDCDKNSWWEDFKAYTSCIVEQKPTWSEEDVAMIDSAIAFVEHSAFTTIGKGKNNVIAWLKSIRDKAQPQPQPRQELSEEDKRIIDNLISQLGNLYARKLIKEGTKDKYVNWLKNLKDKVFPQPNQEWSEVKSGFESLDSLIRTFNNYMKGE